MRKIDKIASYVIGLSCILSACKLAQKNNDFDVTKDVKEEMPIIEPQIEVTKEAELLTKEIEPKVYFIDETGNISNVSDNVYEYYTFGYINTNSEVFDINNNTLKNIDAYQKVLILYDYNNYKYVQFEDLSYGFVKNENITELPETFVEVDISSQKVNFYLNNELYLTTSVITGKKDVHDTRLGCFSIYSKEKNTYLKGEGYNVHVNYWMPFDGGIGLHDASWRYGIFGNDIYVYNGSHGCVNMPDDAVKAIFENVNVGSRVLVHK